ncbi:methyl-accepting chemotaxis protein [Pleionea litopenaei]|uniref:Methyl-accepting chemotaxis protein n=1 Tax=Pleionea litopenaei TaxID=3070815 RepID=A0AA51RQJ3_9GAMM|nr:methyl-accepting chemotaxis protein [Pleionea sp. HL-JVS1]WMS85700.1 methyl-accepting chemotaxis protein [Pleionea sp. HL-JVS1]
MAFWSSSLRNKLIIIFAGALIINTILSSIFLQFERSSAVQLENLIEKQVDEERQVSALVANFKIQVQEWKNVLIRGHDTQQREKYWGRFEKMHDRIQQDAKKLLGSLNEGPAKRLVDDFQKRHAELKALYKKGLDAFIASNFDHKAGDKAVSGIDRAPTETLQNAADVIAQAVAESSTQAIKDAQQISAIATPSIIIISIVLIVLALMVLSSQFTKPVASLMEHVERFGHGDFSVPIHAKSSDELGKMRQQLSNSQAFLRDMMAQVKEASAQLNQNADTVNRASSEIAHGSQSTASRLEQTATAVTEMTSTVQEVAQNASGAAESASNADNAAQQGLSVMNHTIATIDGLSNEVSQASEVIRKLEEDTNSVGTVLDVIRGIAEQTNLLALNAAIEAARAGEQGRGFAVVADEVRNLAQRTQESTAEIQQIIENVQTGAKDAVSAMEKGRGSTSACVEQANLAGVSLKEITAAVNQIHSMNTQIATAAEEQTTVSEDISQNINEISTATAEIHNNVRQFNQLASSLAEMAEELATITDKVKV